MTCPGQYHPSMSNVKYIGQLVMNFEHCFYTRHVGMGHR